MRGVAEKPYKKQEVMTLQYRSRSLKRRRSGERDLRYSAAFLPFFF